MRVRITASSLLCLSLFLAGHDASAETDATPSYTLIDLGPGTGNAVNDSGVVVGSVYDAGNRATLWSPPTWAATDLGIPHSVAIGINGDGVVVGTSESFGAFRWEDGVTMYLGSLPGLPISVATAVNASGQIVGYCCRDHDVAIGYSGPYRAFLWENGVMTDLGTLGGASSSATAINDAGTVVGWSDRRDGRTSHAFAWDAVGGMRDLGAAWVHDFSVATGIDASGHAVGWSYSMTGSCYPDSGCSSWPGPGVATLFDGGAAIAIDVESSRAFGVRDATAGAGVQAVGDFLEHDFFPDDTVPNYASVSAFLWEVDVAGQVAAHDLNGLLDAPFASWLVGASAVDAAGRIVASANVGGVAHVLVLSPSTLAPVQLVLLPPTNLTAQAGKGPRKSQVDLTWTQSVSSNVVSNKVYMRGPDGVARLIATLSPTKSHRVTGLAPRTTYSFWVTAVHASGQESVSSNIAGVVTSR